MQRKSKSTYASLATAGVLTFVVLACAWAAMANAQSTLGTWTIKTPLPAPRGEVAAVAIEGKLHAIGGSVNGTAGPYHDEYDPATDTWRTRAPLPEGRDHLALAVDDGKIFAFGGFVRSVHQGAGSDAFEYDVSTDTWRALPAMKTARGAAGAAAVNGRSMSSAAGAWMVSRCRLTKYTIPNRVHGARRRRCLRHATTWWSSP